MADLDKRVEVEDVYKWVLRETKSAEDKHRAEKDEETKTYWSGQLDMLERLEAFLTV